MKNKLFIMLVCVVVLQSCRESNTDNTFDFATLNRERTAWEAQDIADYVFVVEQITGYPPDNFRARVTVADYGISLSGIEILSLKDYLSGFDPGEPWFEDNIKSAKAEYIKYVESTVRRWGGITGVYDWISSFLSDVKRSEVEVRYNAQYHFLEYVNTDSSSHSKDPDLTGCSGYIIEITDFQIAK